jgi:hypothetical protein
MSNNKIRKSLIASAVVGAFMFGGVAQASSLKEITNVGVQITKASAQSQEKVNNIYEQSAELLAEYRVLVEQTENLKIYNDHVATLVADQDTNLASFDKQIGTIEGTKQGIVPLMYKMVDTLEAFVKADMPIDLQKRLDRIQRVRDSLTNSNIATSEMYRLVIDAYQAERQLGTVLSTYTDKLNVDGGEKTVNFVVIGRVAFLAQTLDDKQAWMWNKKTNQWEALGEEYLQSTKLAIRVAGKQAPVTLLKLPVLAAE